MTQDDIRRMTGDTNDPAALSRALREARRRNNLEGVLDACELLTMTGLRALFEGVTDKPRPTVYPEHAQQVRGALRRVLDLEPSWDELVPPEPPRMMGEAFEWPDTREKIARRIANLARLLPNPQPVVKVCRLCTPHQPFVSTETRCTSRTRAHYQEPMDTPAPTHALRLYIDALKLAKGDGWYPWLFERWGGFRTVNHWAQESRTWASPANNSSPGHPRVYPDGSIECDTECPPLPEVK